MQKYAFRIDDLRGTGAVVKFLSLEPLSAPYRASTLRGSIGQLSAASRDLARAHRGRAWVTDIRDQCGLPSVAFFFKQWGGVNKKKTGRLLEGRKHDGMPSFRASPPVSLIHIG